MNDGGGGERRQLLFQCALVRFERYQLGPQSRMVQAILDRLNYGADLPFDAGQFDTGCLASGGSAGRGRLLVNAISSGYNWRTGTNGGWK